VRAVAILLLLSSLPAAVDTVAAATGISSLSWLSGCWAYDGRDPGSGEHWMPPAGGTMFGISRTVSASKTIEFEYMRIAETDEESLALFASPSGQSPARFDLLSLNDHEVIFENPEHDFPQRIIYRLGDDGALLGRIEGQSDGRPIAVDFPLTRIDCDGPGL
jgi:hypothetical protein